MLGCVVVAMVMLVAGGGQQVWAQAPLSTEERLKLLEQEVAILKRQIEIDKEEASKKAVTVPVVTASAKDGFQIKATDDSYKLKISGYAQADARIFPDNKKDTGTTDTFTTRTVRILLAGTVANNFDFYLSPEFAGTSVTLPDAYLDWRMDPALKIRSGKFKAPFGYERLQSTPGSTFAEPGLAENLAPNRDIGIQVYGDVLKDTVNYALALTNGVADAGGSSTATDTNNDKEINGRIFVQPFRNSDTLGLRGFGLGGAASYGHREDAGSTTSPAYKTAGQTNFYALPSTTFFDGPQLRYSPQLAYYYNSLGIYGEYIASQAKLTKGSLRETITNDGWEAAISYVLTGEDASYKGVVPQRPLDLKKGGWGAFELTGRYSTLDIDDKIFNPALTSSTLAATVPTEARAWTAGVNWYVNRNVKLVLNWEQTTYKGGAAAGANRTPENLILSRMQVSF